MKSDYKYVILGGGISALSFAQSIGVDNDYIIIEKNAKLGGLCRTHYINDYIWDYAGHFFHFADESIKRLFYSQIPSDSIVTCKKNTKIYYNGLLVDYPFQKNIHQLPQDEFIDCLYDLYFRKSSDNYSDFELMLYGKFGKSITDKFLKPYNEKLYACSLHSLDVDAMGRFFPYADIDEIIGNMRNHNNASYNSSFDYPKRGAQAFIDVLIDRIDKDKVAVNTEVIEINQEHKTVRILRDGVETNLKYDYLINTIPLNSFNILSGNGADNRYLSYNQVLVFNIGFDGKLCEKTAHWIYYPSKDLTFYRVGFYDNILSMNKGSIYVEIGFKKEVEINQSIIDEYYSRTLEDLKKVGIVSGQRVVNHEHIVISPGYVHISPQSLAYVENYRDLLKQRGIYLIGRYSEWTYCSMEDCIISAQKLAKELADDSV